MGVQAPYPIGFEEFLRDLWGEEWGVGRNTKKMRERYARVISQEEYRSAQRDWAREHLGMMPVEVGPPCYKGGPRTLVNHHLLMLEPGRRLHASGRLWIVLACRGVELPEPMPYPGLSVGVSTRTLVTVQRDDLGIEDFEPVSPPKGRKAR